MELPSAEIRAYGPLVDDLAAFAPGTTEASAYGRAKGLAQLRALPRLQRLCLEGGFSKQLKVDTLEPLAGLAQLKRLRLASIRAADRSLRPLAGLCSLATVFIAGTFPRDELQSLARALPNARGEFLDSARKAQ